jgi:hypothetical protein
MHLTAAASRFTPALALVLALALAPVGPASATLEAQSGEVVTHAEQVRVGAILQPAWRYQGISDSEDRQGFFLRRARLDVTGSLLEGRVRFRLLPDLARSPELRDAWVELQGEFEGQGVSLRMGQQTVPFDLQRERSSSAMHFGDRAIAARRFELSGGRDVGAVGTLTALEGRFRLQGGAFNGQGANRADPGRTPLLSGRASLSFGGTAARGETDLARTPDPVVSLGLGAMRHEHSFLRPRPGFSADRENAWHSWTADVHARWRGMSLAASWFEQQVDAEGNDERGDGFFVSGGVLLPGHDVEFALRHSSAIWDAARDAGPDDETSVGLTFFHRGHELQTRIQFSRERLFVGAPSERSTNVLTLEHQLLLGG